MNVRGVASIARLGEVRAPRALASTGSEVAPPTGLRGVPGGGGHDGGGLPRSKQQHPTGAWISGSSPIAGYLHNTDSERMCAIDHLSKAQSLEMLRNAADLAPGLVDRLLYVFAPPHAHDCDQRYQARHARVSRWMRWPWC